MRDYFVWLAKLITIFLILLIGIPVLIGAAIVAGKEVSSKDQKYASEGHTVAVVELSGVIEDAKDILEELHDRVADKKIDGIVLRIDSPGGAVAPSQDMYSAVMKLKEKKPIVVSMGSLAASGGFYTAVAGSKILAQPGTMTGSVGVIMQIPNVSKISQMIGFDMITIRAGKLKDAGNSFREMTPEEREYLERTANTVHAQFIRDVATARKISEDKVREFADGRVILGEEAKTLGLIDGFGDVYDAARLVYDLKGSPLKADEAPELVYKEDPLKDFKKMFETISSIPRLLSSRTAQIRFE